MPVVAAAPDAVDKPLIIGVEGGEILSFDKIVGYIDLDKIISEIKARWCNIILNTLTRL